MSNLIDRAQAMMELQMNAKRITLAYEAHGEGHVKFSDDVIKISDAANVLRDLPTITPERKRGRWMKHEDEDGEHYGDKCSVCGEWYVMPYGKTNFCPNCGASMAGDNE